MPRLTILLATLCFSHGLGFQESQEQAEIQTIQFRWTTAGPILDTPEPEGELVHSVKEPSIVYYQSTWHLFCSLRGEDGSRRIGYLAFNTWKDLGSATIKPLTLTDSPFETPQIFYYAPEDLWYLIYQVRSEKENAVAPAFSTTRKVADPSEWSPPTPLEVQLPEEAESWSDFWIICDETQSHLFFTSNDGRIWHAETSHDKFPAGWTEPKVALRGDFVGAPHIYRVRASPHYMALVEAHRQWRRYYKGYLSQSLKGPWKPLAVTRTRSFASLANVEFSGEQWTDSFGHGELVRAGHDERLEVELEGLRFLYQGSSYADREGKLPREVPWRLGILRDERE